MVLLLGYEIWIQCSQIQLMTKYLSFKRMWIFKLNFGNYRAPIHGTILRCSRRKIAFVQQSLVIISWATSYNVSSLNRTHLQLYSQCASCSNQRPMGGKNEKKLTTAHVTGQSSILFYHTLWLHCDLNLRSTSVMYCICCWYRLLFYIAR